MHLANPIQIASFSLGEGSLAFFFFGDRQKSAQVSFTVGEQVTNKEVEIWDQSPTKDKGVWFAVDEEVREPTVEPTKQDRRAPIKIVGGRAWSPGIYQALRLLGKSLDVAWEKAFIRVPTPWQKPVLICCINIIN